MDQWRSLELGSQFSLNGVWSAASGQDGCQYWHRETYILSGNGTRLLDNVADSWGRVGHRNLEKLWMVIVCEQNIFFK